MNKTVIFGGTTEGRILSERLSRAGRAHLVCVAGTYGEEVLRESSCARIHIGRMDEEEMVRFFTSEEIGAEDLILDATHPYATQVTENIGKAAERVHATCVRVLRKPETISVRDAVLYSDITECAGALGNSTGNILLTTGSKELPSYCAAVSDEVKKRTYVRVLPSEESLMICRKEGIEPDHIIAMQGPFSESLNRAIYGQYEIRHLVTKESGKAGGFDEKIRAAAEENVRVHLIRRPGPEEGITVDEVWERFFPELSGGGEYLPSLVLAGIGMGSEDGMTVAVRKAIEEADAVFGSGRLIRDLRVPVKYEMYRTSEIIPVLERDRPVKAVVLFSGDTGFYSGAKEAAKGFRKWREDVPIRVLPGISSIAYLAAKLGETYEDAAVVSLHGKNTPADIVRLLDSVSCTEKTYALLSDAGDIRMIATAMTDRGMDGTIVAGTDLSYATEQIRSLSLDEATDFTCDGPVTILIRNPASDRRILLPVRRDEDFMRERIPMTKECVRHESLIRLAPRERDLLYDIGGGTGAVAIEAAALDPSLRIVTIERNSEAVALIRRNAEKNNTQNLTILEGEATELLPGLEKPDGVFVGGSGGRLREILKILHGKGEGIRFVINAVSLETLEEITGFLREYEVREEKVTQIAVSEAEKIGEHRLMRAQNPVFIISFTL